MHDSSRQTPPQQSEHPPVPQPEPSPEARGKAPWGRLCFVIVLGLIADLASKSLAFRFLAPSPVRIDAERVVEMQRDQQPLGMLLPMHEPTTIVPGLLEFTLVLNPGAVFGSGSGKRWFFVVFTVLAVGFALWMFRFWTRATDRWAHLAIGLLIAGGLGNLYDRVVYACVRDFIHPLPGVVLPFGWSLPNGQREVWPYVSNVADLLLIIGVSVLVVYSWRRDGSSCDESSD